MRNDKIKLETKDEVDHVDDDDEKKKSLSCSVY